MIRNSSSNERAVSPVIGAILLVAILVALVGLLQLNAVPALTSQAEFEHNQHVQGEVRDIAAGIDRTATTGTSQSVAVTPGVQYPSRVVLVNPPPARGTIQTGEPRDVTIDGASADGATGDYWNGEPKAIETRSLSYEPTYNEYHNAPETVYELGTIYNRIDETTIVTEEQSPISDRKIALTMVAGEFRHTGIDRTLVDLRPSSTETRTVALSDTDGPITLTIPTELSEDEWEKILESELDDNGGYVADYRCANEPPEPCGELTITLQHETTYELQLTRVGVGSETVTQTPAYLTDLEGNETSVRAGATQQLVTEVRDQLDNPVSGESVTAEIVSGPGELRTDASTSGTDGRTRFVYEAPADVSGTEDVTVEATFGDGAAEQTVTFSLRVWGESDDGSDEPSDPSDPGDPDDTDGPADLWVNITDVVDQSNPIFDRYEVTAALESAQSELSHAEFQLIDSTTGDVLDTASDETISGTTAIVTEDLQHRPESQDNDTQYRIDVTAYTTDGTSESTSYEVGHS